MIAESEIKLEEKPAAVRNAHLIGKFEGDSNGATLVVVGSIHGNEAGGAAALRKVTRSIQILCEKLRGRVYFLAGNTRALAEGVRFIDADLNRHWTAGNIVKNKSNFPISRAEDAEQRELLGIFDEILKTARDEVYVLDLHSTSAEGLPFATVGDTLRNRHFVRKFPVTILLGIEEQLEGTMLEYLNNAGCVTFGFEGGQHYLEETARNHEALVWLALVNSGLLTAADIPDWERHRQHLAESTKNRRIIEIRYRHAIKPEDEFEMLHGFENFQAIERGQVLARDRRGEIRAKESGMIIMPLYQKQGDDGFFVGREVAPFWIWLSEVLRNRKIADLMPLLPGVRRHPTDAETLIVDTKIARFFPLQIFHLLGFRRRRWQEHKLVVSRRRHDKNSPFKIRR